MSTTMTLTLAPMATDASQSCCPHCGNYLAASNSNAAIDAQKQIEDLKAQVKLLTQKASAAVDKWADYEDEIQRLQSANQASPPNTARSTTATQVLPVQSRLSSLLSSRKSTLVLPPPPMSPASTTSERDLMAALTREQALRQQAEGKLDEASGELEELSAQLFQQANEMVATERKARAKLEERIEILERRDAEKGKRLDRLEGAMARIERVRGLLAPKSPGTSVTGSP